MKKLGAEKGNYLQMLCECLKESLMKTWILAGNNKPCKIPFLIPETCQWWVISLKISFFTYTLIQNIRHNITNPHWFSSACNYSGSKTNGAGEVTSIFWVPLIKTRPQYSDHHIPSKPSHHSILFTYTYTILRYS